MANTLILIANGRRARFFVRDSRTTNLSELADFIYPYATGLSAPRNRRTGLSSEGHGRTAHSRRQFESRTNPLEKSRSSFAQQLADFMNQGVAHKQCSRVAVIASDPMLGAIKPLLSPLATEKLCCSVPLDLTRYRGPELRHRIIEAVDRLP